MSKIQAMFNARGRRLFDSERAEVEAFNAKYAGTTHGTGEIVQERQSTKVITQPRSFKKVAIKRMDRAEKVRVAKKRVFRKLFMMKVLAVVSERSEREEVVVYLDARSGKPLSERERGLAKNLAGLPTYDVTV